MKSYLEQSPPFVPEQAFVVQFGRETAVDTGRMAGRVAAVAEDKPRQHMLYVYASLSRLDFQGLLENAIVVF